MAASFTRLNARNCPKENRSSFTWNINQINYYCDQTENVYHHYYFLKILSLLNLMFKSTAFILPFTYLRAPYLLTNQTIALNNNWKNWYWLILYWFADCHLIASKWIKLCIERKCKHYFQINLNKLFISVWYNESMHTFIGACGYSVLRLTWIYIKIAYTTWWTNSITMNIQVIQMLPLKCIYKLIHFW